MPTPTNRTPVRVARGTYSNLNTNKADIQEGEICYATDQDKLYVKEGSNLVDASTTDISAKANLAGPTFTGVPTAPTASSGTNTTQLATTAFVTAAIPAAVDISGKANIASPTFTGTVAIPNIANLETAVTANTAKVTNATHTGDVTGSTALTIATGAVETGMIADDAVTSAKLDTNIVLTGTVSDSKGDLRKIIQNTQSSTYTLVAADAGKHIIASGTVTVPNSVFAAGDAVTIVNNTASDLTITKTITTMYLSSDGTSANRTLATRGMATILFTSGTVAYISGAGLS